jgi:GT2 family glycosyltransferase
MGYMPILGAAFMCRTALFDEIGMFPEELKIFFGDNWIVLASQAKGYDCGYAQDSYLHHLFCITTSKINQGPHWKYDGDAFKEIAAKIGIPMKPYVQRVGEDWRKLPVTGVR